MSFGPIGRKFIPLLLTGALLVGACTPRGTVSSGETGIPSLPTPELNDGEKCINGIRWYSYNLEIGLGFTISVDIGDYVFIRPEEDVVVIIDVDGNSRVVSINDKKGYFYEVRYNSLRLEVTESGEVLVHENKNDGACGGPTANFDVSIVNG